MYVLLLFLLTMFLLSFAFMKIPGFGFKINQNRDSDVVENFEWQLPNNDCHDTHALMAPNIPDDVQTRYRVGGKFYKKLDYPLAPKEGKYEFPKPKLLYDGIWESHRTIDDNNIETQKWTLVKKYFPTKGKYATDKFFHLPLKSVPIGTEVCESDIHGEATPVICDHCDKCLDTQDMLGVIYVQPLPGMKINYP